MTNQKLQVISYFTLLGIAFVIVVLIFFPFLKTLALAAILAVLFLPVHRDITKKIKSETWGAIISLLLILLIVIVPVYVVGQLIFNELSGIYSQVSVSGYSISQSALLEKIPQTLRPYVESLGMDAGKKLTDLAQNAFAATTNLAANLAGFVLSFFLFFFSLYYLMRDGSRLKNYIYEIFPFSESHENALIKKLEDAVSGVVKGSFLVALIQGLVGTLGYLIFGLPAAFLWGAFTVIAALVPNVGTLIAWLPAVIYLLVTGHTGSAIGLAIWSILITGTIDNIVSPRLVGGKVKLHPLLVLISVLGGIHLFGYMGFLLGPIIMAIFVALLDIYRTDLKMYLEK